MKCEECNKEVNKTYIIDYGLLGIWIPKHRCSECTRIALKIYHGRIDRKKIPKDRFRNMFKSRGLITPLLDKAKREWEVIKGTHNF